MGRTLSTLDSQVDGPLSPARARQVAWIVAATFFMEMLDGSIVVTALPAIAREFGTDTMTAALSVTVYLAAMVAGIPLSGWLAQRLGAREVFAGAVGAFAIASLACGVSPTYETFVVARIVQGVSAAFMSPVGRLVVLRETPRHRIIEGIALITWPGLIAPILGPPLGGLISTHASWRWIFLINVPLGLVALAFVLRRFPRRAVDARHHPFDLAGFVWTGLATTLLVLGLTWLGEGHHGLPLTLTLIACGAACVVGAVRHARRVPAPLLDLDAVRVRTFEVATVTAGFVSRVAINATPFLLPLMFQVGFGMDAVQAGVLLIFYMGGNLAMKGITTPLLRRFGFRSVMLTNGALCAASILACSLLRADTALPVTAALLVVAGMTRSLNFTAVATLAFADIGDAQRPGATALATLLQQLAMALGVAFGASVIGLSRALRGAASAAEADFIHAWLVVGVMMLGAVALMLRLAPDAGDSVARAGKTASRGAGK